MDYAYGEVDAGFGHIRFGRMPIEWGSGMVYNAEHDPLDEFGDSADRLPAPVGAVYLIGAIETSAENFVNASDDMLTYTGGVAYLGERYGIGTYNTYRVRTFADGTFTLFTGDVWARAENRHDRGMGVRLPDRRWKLVRRHQRRHRDGDWHATHRAAGQRHHSVRRRRWSGLRRPRSLRQRIPNLGFDPDFNVAHVRGAHAGPGARSPSMENNGGRETGAVRMGEGVSNALYLRPAIQYTVSRGSM